MALNCSINQGRDRACKDAIGGNKIAYLINGIEGDNPFTVNEATGLVTAINPLITEVFAFPLEGDGNTLTQAKTSDRNTGTSVVTQTLVMNLKRIDATTSAQMNILAHGYPYAVVADRMGNYQAIGIDDGIDFAVEENTGGAKTDMNGYVLTGTATTRLLAPMLEGEVLTSFLGLVAGFPSV